ncbi:MAG: hypothetical protein Q4D62_00490 [Planctomycetia bacterium]|nr:hypothetical protein [Planctomycetia bacterium]
MFARLFQPWFWLLTAGILWGGSLYAGEWEEELLLREKVDLQLQLRAKRHAESLGNLPEARLAVEEGFRFLYSEPSRLEYEKEVDWTYLKEAIQTLAGEDEDVGVRSALAFLEKSGQTASVREQYLHTALKKFACHSPQWQALLRWGKVSRFLETVGKLDKCRPILPQDFPSENPDWPIVEIAAVISTVSRILEEGFSCHGELLPVYRSSQQQGCFFLSHIDNHVVQVKQTMVLLI